jgi:GT2 family glycosyltransferase/glycosyltransferase involved in cell wall biosynthesis
MKRLIKNKVRTIYQRLPLSIRLRRLIREKIYSFLSLPQRFYSSIFKNKAKHPFQLPLIKLNLPDVFIFAVIDWSFRVQRPQHIAKALAQKGHRVFYISNNFKNLSTSDFDAKKLDETLPLYLTNLALNRSPAIYSHRLTPNEFQQLTRSLAKLLDWTGYHETLSLVDHAFWTNLAFSLPNNAVIYDCMDHHAGFADTAPIVIENEKLLFQKADLVLTSSQKLHEEASCYNTNVSLIRNATDYDYFKNPPADIYRDTENRKIIGYYGAIAEWFDLEIIEKLAIACAENLILLVGNDTVFAAQKLKKYKNILFTGEVTYAELPYYLHAFDVCIIPFKINPLTEATNPVKVYEYLSAGKPVVTVDLPECRELSNYVAIGHSVDEFCQKTKGALANAGNPQPRQQFAATQTWTARIDSFEEALKKISKPLVSIIVLTYNNLKLTQACLESVEKFTNYPNYEVIIVDNASTDGTQDYLKAHFAHHTLILNTENTGFSAGNNKGISMAKGEYIVLLSNDTVVTPGWLTTLINHFERNPQVGLLGPITNNIGNEAKVKVFYTHPVSMLPEVQKIAATRMGKLLPIKTLAFFCVMIPRKIIDEVGLLDERFGLGFFEDDDYCRRVEKAGHKIFCAEDVFIHHYLSASFDKLSNEKRTALFENNKKLYETKWGKWEKHRFRHETA